MPVATGARFLARFAQRRAQALPGHLEQPKARNAAGLDPCLIHLQCVPEPLLHLPLVTPFHHVDEVDHDQAAEIAQAQLPRDLVRRLEVGVVGGLLDVGALGRTRRVDVDRQHGLGVVEHQGAARGQVHGARERRFDLAFDLVTVEQRHLVGVQLQLAQIVRHHLLHEFPGIVVNRFVVDQDFADVVAQVIAQGADEQVAFLVDQIRNGALRVAAACSMADQSCSR